LIEAPESDFKEYHARRRAGPPRPRIWHCGVCKAI